MWKHLEGEVDALRAFPLPRVTTSLLRALSVLYQSLELE